MISLAMQLLKAEPAAATAALAVSISAVRIWEIFLAICLAICLGAVPPEDGKQWPHERRQLKSSDPYQFSGGCIRL